MTPDGANPPGLSLRIALDVLAASLAPDGQVIVDRTPPPWDAVARAHLPVGVESALLPAGGLTEPPPPGLAATRHHAVRAGFARAVTCALPSDLAALDAAAGAVAPGGRFGLIVGGPLGPFLARLRGVENRVLGAAAARRRLATERWSLESQVAIGGLSVAMWTLLARCAERAERPDLVDRFEVGYRRASAARRDRLPGELVVILARAGG